MSRLVGAAQFTASWVLILAFCLASFVLAWHLGAGALEHLAAIWHQLATALST